ncbi:hypothetical protein BHM03_00032775 [Ensete ventricosum]|nr:hypothetical protein BHM03_00032775 [Ensete ventricosum]
MGDRIENSPLPIQDVHQRVSHLALSNRPPLNPGLQPPREAERRGVPGQCDHRPTWRYQVAITLGCLLEYGRSKGSLVLDSQFSNGDCFLDQHCSSDLIENRQKRSHAVRRAGTCCRKTIKGGDHSGRASVSWSVACFLPGIAFLILTTLNFLLISVYIHLLILGEVPIFNLTSLNGPISATLFLGFSLFMVIAIMLATGTVGFIFHYILSSVKLD